MSASETEIPRNIWGDNRGVPLTTKKLRQVWYVAFRVSGAFAVDLSCLPSIFLPGFLL